MIRVSYAVEGWTDEPVAEKLLREIGCEPWRRFTAAGKARLDPKVPGYNRSAQHQPWLVLRDLDHDAPCAASLVEQLLGATTKCMAFRVPIRSIEAWLMADQQAFANHFHVQRGKVPSAPDTLHDPKQALVDTCRSSSSSSVRAAVVPKPAARRKVGPEYGATVWEFARESWRIEAAFETSPSLRRTIDRLSRLIETGAWQDRQAV